MWQPTGWRSAPDGKISCTNSASWTESRSGTSLTASVWPTTRIDIVVATGIGPRLLRCGFVGGPNLLGEYPERLATTPLGDWRPRGGHRLWAAPELMPGSYAPDNDPVGWEVLSERVVTLQQEPDGSDLAKTLTIRLADRGATLTLHHQIRNAGQWPVQIAPWAITIVAPGGVAFCRSRSFAVMLNICGPFERWPYGLSPT